MIAPGILVSLSATDRRQFFLKITENIGKNDPVFRLSGIFQVYMASLLMKEWSLESVKGNRLRAIAGFLHRWMKPIPGSSEPPIFGEWINSTPVFLFTDAIRKHG